MGNRFSVKSCGEDSCTVAVYHVEESGEIIKKRHTIRGCASEEEAHDLWMSLSSEKHGTHGTHTNQGE